MKNFLITLSTPLMLISTAVSAQETQLKAVNWSLAAQLKNRDGSPSKGFAGAINAVTNKVLIVAGGANFPDKMPWEGGEKYYSKEIQVLHRVGDKFIADTSVNATLPEAIAYCGQTVTSLGLVYAGGENDNGLSKKAFLINWNAGDHRIEVKALPDLPIAVTNVALTAIGDVVYAIGGDQEKSSSKAVFSLNLNGDQEKWQTLPPLPVALANAVVVLQASEIYVIGGRTKTASGISELRGTTYAFHPEQKVWRSRAPLKDGKNLINFSAGAGVSVGEAYILITGGDNGEIFHQIETYIAAISKTYDLDEKARLTAAKNALSIHHKGFYRGLLLYHIHTNTWKKIGELPFPAQVTTTATKWGDDIVLSNGEVKPGVRTPNIMLGKLKFLNGDERN